MFWVGGIQTCFGWGVKSKFGPQMSAWGGGHGPFGLSLDPPLSQVSTYIRLYAFLDMIINVVECVSKFNEEICYTK